MKKERVFWGIFFIAAAVFLIVGKLGYFRGIGFWTLLLSVFFGACLIKSILQKSVTGLLFSAAFLCIVYAGPLGIEAITPWPVLGAALLGSIGVSFFYHPKGSYWHGHHDDENWVGSVETMDGSQLKLSTSCAGSVKYVDSQEFKSADVKCSFGAMKVYLDKAAVPSGEAVIRMDVSFGGLELYVPRSWKVINQVDAIFGGLEEKSSGNPNGSPALILTGSVKFAGVEIIYI